MRDIEEITKPNVLLSSILARHLGLDRRYFSRKKQNITLQNGIEVFKYQSVIFVNVPMSLYKYLQNDFQAILLENEDAEDEFEYIFKLDKNKKIGFWK